MPARASFHAEVRKDAFDLPEVNAEPDDFHEPAAPADNLVQARRIRSGQIAGAELMDGPAQGKILRALRVPEHHVRARVDKLAVLHAGNGVDAEAAARDGNSDGPGAAGRQTWRKVCHPCGGLRLSVHHEEVPPAPPAVLGIAFHCVGHQPAACLRDIAEAGQFHVGEPHAVKEFEGVGDRSEGRNAMPAEQFPEAGVHDRQVSQDKAGSAQQVAVDHGQSIAVGHRQRCYRTVVLSDAEVVGNGLGVGLEVGVGKADQFGGSRGARRAHQQRQVGVQLVPGYFPSLFQHVLSVGSGSQDDVGVVGGHERVEGSRFVFREKDQRMAARQRREVPDDGGNVVAGSQGHEPPRGSQPKQQSLDAFCELLVSEDELWRNERRPFTSAA